MSQGLNKTTIIGYLGRDPETNGGQNGNSVTRFTVGVTERWRDRDNIDQEHTEWFRVVTFNGLSESCAQFLSKGRRVYVEGRLRTRSFTNRRGEEQTGTELLAVSVMFLDGPRRAEQDADDRPRPDKSAAAEDETDDVPF
jgi:single-strand DNA-binding protein